MKATFVADKDVADDLTPDQRKSLAARLKLEVDARHAPKGKK